MKCKCSVSDRPVCDEFATFRDDDEDVCDNCEHSEACHEQRKLADSLKEIREDIAKLE